MRILHENPEIPNRLLWFGTSPSHFTSHSICGEKINEYLRETKKFNLLWLGLQSLGNRLPKWELPLGRNINGDDRLAEVIIGEQIDTLITFVNDFDPMYHYIGKLAKALRIKYIVHAQVNTSPLTELLLPNLDNATHIVVPSKFSEKTLREFGFNNVTYIPHGVDTNIFKPITHHPEFNVELADGGKTYFKVQEGLAPDTFVFGMVGANIHGQKNFHAAIYAYSILLYQHPELKEKTRLWIHTDLKNPSGLDIEGFAKRQGNAVWDNLIFPKPFRIGYEYGPKEMSILYNIFDCLLVTSLHESFHMPTLEAMACGAPIIGADHTAIKEHIEDSKAGILVKNYCSISGQGNSESWLIDEQALADAMYEMYINKEKYQEYSKSAIEYANQDIFKWENICEQWYNLIKEVLNPKLDYMDYNMGI